jgi:CHAD domain-containing protein
MAASQLRTFDAQKKDLAYWMEQVLEEHSKLGRGLAAEPVHDLRVALRRCILIAEVIRGLDPQGNWKAMSKAAKRVFRDLGALRDTQVLMGWVERLGPPGEASTLNLAAELKAREERHRASAQEAVRDFDRKKSRNWARELSPRFRHVAANKAACESLVLGIWESVRDLHRRAQKSRSWLAYHRLRVQVKKFRYAVENFLPAAYAAWESDLKSLQDLLGEVHDLDLLSQEVLRKDLVSEEASRTWWRTKLDVERAARLQQYRAKTAGKSSPLWMWREGLPAEKDVRAAGLAKLAEWAYFVTPDFPEVRRIAKFALQLYDGFAGCGLIPEDLGYEGRSILQAAALLQEVGRFRRNKAHHKESYRMIRSISPPAGWSRRDMELAALVARFHRGALPRPDHKLMKAYSLPLRQSLLLLAALLRLANAFCAKPYRAVRRLQAENCSGVILVRAEGYVGMDPPAPKLSSAKHLVEFACHHPVHILPPGMQIPGPLLVQQTTRSDAA